MQFARGNIISFALLLLRIGVGIFFIKQGWGKFVGGPTRWHWLGSQMSNIGINFLPIVWGFAAACAEFFGGIALLLGLRARIASVFMGFVMFVATVMHVTNGDSFGTILFPMYFLVVFIFMLILGPGIYSVDYWTHNNAQGE